MSEQVVPSAAEQRNENMKPPKIQMRLRAHNSVINALKEPDVRINHLKKPGRRLKT
jgi:hypothetical protein